MLEKVKSVQVPVSAITSSLAETFFSSRLIAVSGTEVESQFYSFNVVKSSIFGVLYGKDLLFSRTVFKLLTRFCSSTDTAALLETWVAATNQKHCR